MSVASGFGGSAAARLPPRDGPTSGAAAVNVRDSEGEDGHRGADPGGAEMALPIASWPTPALPMVPPDIASAGS
jgi:hypothetical protein